MSRSRLGSVLAAGFSRVSCVEIVTVFSAVQLQSKMSPLTLVGLLVITPALADVKHVLDGTAHPPEPNSISPDAVNNLASNPYWWMDSNSPFKAAYDYYKKCNTKGNCLLSPTVNPNAPAPQPFLPQEPIKINIDVKKNPFLSGSFNPTKGDAHYNSGGSKIDVSKNPFLSGKVVTTGNGSPVIKDKDGFLGVQPAQPFKKQGFSTTHPLDQKKPFAIKHPLENSTDCKGAGFMCVTKNLCLNGVANVHGEGLLQVRSDVRYCRDGEVCCRMNNLHEVTPGKSSVPESTIKFAGGAGFSAGLIHVQPLIVEPDVVFSSSHSSATSKSVRDTSFSPSTVDYSDVRFGDDARFGSTFQGPAYLPPLLPSTPSESSNVNQQLVPKPSTPEYVPPSLTTQRPGPVVSTTSRITPTGTVSTSREYLPPRSSTSAPTSTVTQYVPPQRPYEPSVTPQQPYQPSVTPQRPYQPSVTPQQTQTTSTPQRPYQPSVTPQQPYQPSVTPQRPYQPSVTPSRSSVTTQRPYQPSITPQQPGVTPLNPYQPCQPNQPGATPQQPCQSNITPQQPYQPCGTPQQPYQPGVTPQQNCQPNVTPQRPYQPSESSVTTQRPYQPSITPQQPQRPYQPNVTPQQPYQPSVTPQQPYQPSVTPQQPYQPSVTPQRPYQPSQSTVTTQRPYQPSITPQQPGVTPQRPYQPTVTPQQPYQPSVTPQRPYQPSEFAVTTQRPYQPSPTTQQPYQPSETPQQPHVTPQRPYQPSVTPQQPYQPSVTPGRLYQPNVTPQQPYQPSVTPQQPYQPSVTPQQPYQPSVTPQKPYQPSVTPQQPYQPSVTPQQPYQPSVTPQKPYQPSVTPQQPYQPSVTPQKPYQPSVTPQQPYQPSVTPQQPYQPSVTPQKPYQPSVTPQQPYQPSVTPQKPYQPGVTPQQPYQPIVTPSRTSVSTERPYQPSVTPQQPYQPSVTPQQPYQPSVTPQRPYQPSVTPQQPYQPSVTPQRPYQPNVTPQQPYQPSSPRRPNPFLPQQSTVRPETPTSPPFRPTASIPQFTQSTTGYEYTRPSPQPTPSTTYYEQSTPSRPVRPSITSPTPHPNPAGGYNYPTPTPIFEYPSTPSRDGDGTNINNAYVPPPQKPTDNVGEPGNNVFRYELNTSPPTACAAALKCVQEIYCTAEGVISPVPVVLTKEQELSRVPTTECQDTEAGIVGKCCRDSNYKDPWPSANLVNGIDDGQYKEDDGIGQYQQDLQRNVRSSNATAACGERHLNTKPQATKPLEVNFAEIPWQAMVLRDSNRSLLCGGVIIRLNAVLTAAHCVEGLPTNDILIKGGEWKLGIEEEPLPFQVVSVAAVIRHPQYQKGSLLNDLALLVLEERLRPSKNVGTLCLPPPNQIATQNCIATGWGKRILQLHAKGAIMRAVDVKIMDNQQCQETLTSKFQDFAASYSPNTLCGYSSADQCKVDYGSALACTDGTHYTLSGIFSWDTGCKRADQIGGYVAPDVEWIESVLSKPLDQLRN